MDWDKVGEKAAIAVVSGLASIVGTALKLRKSVKSAEAKLLAQGKGWRIELDTFKADQEKKYELLKQEFEGYKRLRDEVEAARKEERSSQNDPFEVMNESLEKLREDIERLKERRGRYVTNETLTAFMRSQEEQWRLIHRALGQLEGELKK